MQCRFILAPADLDENRFGPVCHEYSQPVLHSVHNRCLCGTVNASVAVMTWRLCQTDNCCRPIALLVSLRGDMLFCVIRELLHHRVFSTEVTHGDCSGDATGIQLSNALRRAQHHKSPILEKRGVRRGTIIDTGLGFLQHSRRSENNRLTDHKMSA